MVFSRWCRHRLTPFPQESIFSDQEVCFIKHLISVGLRFFIQPLILNELDGGVGHDPTKPSVIFEVGDSESLTQLEIDMKFWFQDVPEVRPFLSFVRTHSLGIFFRYNSSSLFWSTHPFLPTQIFQELPSSYGEHFTPFVLYAHQHLRKDKPVWSGKLTGVMLPHRCIYYFLISLESRCLQSMATTIACIWTLWFGGRKFFNIFNLLSKIQLEFECLAVCLYFNFL